MDITQRQITKIAREAGKFTSRTIKEEGVGTAEFDLIHVVRERPGITQSEICRILGADKGAVAKQTANLEAKGYLQRQSNPSDGRSQLIYPTEQAQRLKNRILTRRTKSVRRRRALPFSYAFEQFFGGKSLTFLLPPCYYDMVVRNMRFSHALLAR